ncbi:MAG: preprotein translocase subunit SecA [Candidatus Gracilibacteria bacterium]|nr:preprotein translocase subunit SecA [Candidatus Gracilibacteria bacterium]
MLTKIINKIIGDPNEKEIKRCRKKIPTINSFFESYQDFDESQVKAKTEEFKKRVQNGESLDNILPEAFGLIKRACKMLVGTTYQVRGNDVTWEIPFPYDVQLIGGMILHEGKIGEMKTGEGKTLVATLPLYLNALPGKGAYLVTVNDYLAHRDAEWMKVLYNFLGLTVGVIQHGQNQEEKKAAYACDITYGTNNEFGFDYLRDNMATNLEACVQRDLHYAIVDEVDSILIDEARTPLIISAPAEEVSEKYIKYSKLVTQLEEDLHYKLDEKARSCILTDEGVEKMEELLGMKNIYTEAGATEVHHIEQSLKARTLFTKDVDYMVKEGQVMIIDEFTGRLMPGRRYSEGLHQAIEAKEKVKINRESKTLATITFQNYFRLFDKLAGMTGTAITEAEEFESIYALETIVIPTNRPIARKDMNDLIYKSTYGKLQAVTQKVKELQENGQPCLVGTISVEQSELLSEMFAQSGVKHNVLNAKHHEREAEIVANAGTKGSVTIATNMAGRGTDIKISDEIKALGGLYIIGTERHESRRIDNQLRGRSGRQGDPGASQFYVSMEDDLMRLFGGDKLRGWMERLNVPEDMPIENGMVTRSIESSQKKVEGRNFDIRKHLVEYDDVMNKHRTIIYQRRRVILENENIHNAIIELFKKSAAELANSAIISKYPEEWLIDKLIEDIHSLSGKAKAGFEEKIKKMISPKEIEEYVSYFLVDALMDKKDKVDDEKAFFNVEHQVYLRTIDKLWMEHIDAMVKLREQVSLRGYAQKDPLIEYKKEGFAAFELLLSDIQHNTLQTLLRMEMKVRVPTPQTQPIKTNDEEISDINTGDREPLPKTKHQPKVISADEPQKNQQVFGMASPISNPNNAIKVTAQATPENTQEAQIKEKVAEVGRNESCPCESGKKYKKCHGA